ncbi:hypothetical protein [Thermaurantiacus sp.]
MCGHALLILPSGCGGFDPSLSLVEVEDPEILTREEGFDRVRVRSRAQFRFGIAR